MLNKVCTILNVNSVHTISKHSLHFIVFEHVDTAICNVVSQSLLQVMCSNSAISQMLTHVRPVSGDSFIQELELLWSWKVEEPEVRAEWSDALGWLIIEVPVQTYTDICAMFWNVKNNLWDSFFWLLLVMWCELIHFYLGQMLGLEYFCTFWCFPLSKVHR